ncbi:MAG: DNA polymerase III subunit epsilon [Meiothermus sp.]
MPYAVSRAMSPTHYRLSTRIARRLREAAGPLPKAQLAQEVLASPQLPQLSWSGKLLEGLLDGRFRTNGQEVSLWEWDYPFPPRSEPVVVLDLETTGLSPEANEVIEMAFVRLENGNRTEFQRLVNPGCPIPPFIARLTRIRDQDVRSAPDVYTVLEEAWPLLQGATLIIQNAGFDLGFLKPRLARLGYRLDNAVVDTVQWARKALPGLPKRGLDALAFAFDLGEVQGRHRALGDVNVTAQVAYEMYYMLTAGTPRPLGEL